MLSQVLLMVCVLIVSTTALTEGQFGYIPNIRIIYMYLCCIVNNCIEEIKEYIKLMVKRMGSLVA